MGWFADDYFLGKERTLYGLKFRLIMAGAGLILVAIFIFRYPFLIFMAVFYTSSFLAPTNVCLYLNAIPVYEFENKFLANQHIEFYPAVTEEEMVLFERKHAVKLPVEITEFYRCLNGYYHGNDMVDFYPFHRIVTLKESRLNRPLMPAIDQFFVLGDYGFQGSFWPLRNEAITEVLTKGAYWDIMTAKYMATHCYKVERNGNCHYYYYSRLNGCRTLSDSEDQVFDTTWRVDAGRDLIRLQGLE